MLFAPATLPDGASVLTWVLALAGNAFIVVFIVRTLGAYAKKEWGELVINIIAAILLAGLIWSNEATMNLLRSLWTTFAG